MTWACSASFNFNATWIVFNERNVWSVVERWMEEMILALARQFKQFLSHVHLKNFRCFQLDSNPWPLQCWCSAFTNWATCMLYEVSPMWGNTYKQLLSLVLTSNASISASNICRHISLSLISVFCPNKKGLTTNTLLSLRMLLALNCLRH